MLCYFHFVLLTTPLPLPVPGASFDCLELTDHKVVIFANLIPFPRAYTMAPIDSSIIVMLTGLNLVDK